MSDTCTGAGPEHLRHARDELKKAAETLAAKVLPPETTGHLRQAARHVLQAGLAALDEADRKAKPAPAIIPA